ncbi:hypothetical protein CEP52_005177 [Fusarium oligoseptatum]|uniref:Uncharacterized protein n=1 Tax=Fusarium oligoseptatum TaxID=2604345 RepID=A0A428TZM3_9HYPO|nr:hypothetical protein CEP52_005177 [Fusarium oligoseptatum]
MFLTKTLFLFILIAIFASSVYAAGESTTAVFSGTITTATIFILSSITAAQEKRSPSATQRAEEERYRVQIPGSDRPSSGHRPPRASMDSLPTANLQSMPMLAVQTSHSAFLLGTRQRDYSLLCAL